jgi:dipeptide/tripeptide permease
MFNLKNLLKQQPVAISAAVISFVNLCSLFGLFEVSADQLAALDTALVLILGLFTWNAVTPVAPKE